MTGRLPLAAVALRRRARLAVASALLGGLLLAGCGPDGCGASNDGPAAASALTPAPGDSAAGSASSAGPLRLPGFTLPTLDGATLSQDDLAGAPLVLHFWASWSQPSLGELPLLDSLSRATGGTLRIVGVLEAEDDLADARALADSLGLAYPVVVDTDGRLADGLDHVTMLPTTVFVDATGAVVDRRVGAFPSASALEAKLRRLRAEAAPTGDALQVHALDVGLARVLIEDGAAVYDVREPTERRDVPLPARVTPAPLAALAPNQLPDDLSRPLLFVGDSTGARAQLAAEQALAWGHRRVYFTRGALSALFGAAVNG